MYIIKQLIPERLKEFEENYSFNYIKMMKLSLYQETNNMAYFPNKDSAP